MVYLIFYSLLLYNGIVPSKSGYGPIPSPLFHTACRLSRHLSVGLARPSSLPQLSGSELLGSQLSLLQVERESVESRLRQAQATIATLTTQNKGLKNKAAKNQGLYDLAVNQIILV